MNVQYLDYLFLQLAPVAVLVAAGLVALAYWKRRSAYKDFGEWQLLAAMSRPVTVTRWVLGGLCAAASVALLMVALARPYIEDGTVSIARGTVDVVAVVDVSRSMAAMDYEGKVPPSAVAKPDIPPGTPDGVAKKAEAPQIAGTRLEMVRHVLLDRLLGELDGNQVGVVSYAGEAFPQAFLTRDRSSLAWVINRGLTISSAPGEGSAMGKALDLGLAMFAADSPPDHQKVMVLFSDGGNDDKLAELGKLAAEIRAKGIKLIVVGMGNARPSPIPVSKLAFDDPVADALMKHGKKFYEADGQVQRTGMDGQLLQALASQAGGKYIHLQEDTDLSMLSQVGKTAMVQTPGRKELFPYALIGALLAFFLSIAVTSQWRGRRRS